MDNDTFLVVRINDRCRPIERGDYEDPLHDVLVERKLGEVTGGGTQLNENRVIEYCEIDVNVTGDLALAKETIKEVLEANGLPKGSKIIDGNEELEIGNHDVMALHFDDVGLPDSVYEEHDINSVLETVGNMLEDIAQRNSHAVIGNETVVYYGGLSFENMKNTVEEYFLNHPLGKNGRITQAA